MSGTRNDTTDVLVVGGGPAGLTAAHELARRGLRVRVIDKAAAPAVTSRATATHARTLETYHQMGILDEILARGHRVANFSMHMRGRRLIRFGTDYSELPTRFPFTLQIDQVLTEQVLRDKLAGYGVAVEWSVALAEFEDTGDEVVTKLRHEDGREETCRVPWLVGADGAHSTVRKQLGLRLLGDSTEKWLIADAHIDLGLPRDSLHWMHTGRGTILLVPFPDEGKWRVLDTADATTSDEPEVVRARLQRKISYALRRQVEVAEPSWISVFTIQQRMIERMRAGRCFVVGDAAHVHSPASGQGMNTCVQDAVNLGWKLADVVRGNAAEELLDSYEAERVPVGQLLLGSTKTATALIALRNVLAPVLLPIGLGLLNRLTPAKKRAERKILRGMSGLAQNYAASPLTMPEPRPATDGFTPGDRVGCSTETARESAGWAALCEGMTDPRWTLLVFGTADEDQLIRIEKHYGDAVTLRRVGGADLADPGDALARSFGLAAGGIALIRPDGYLAASTTSTAAPEDLLAGCHLVARP